MDEPPRPGSTPWRSSRGWLVAAVAIAALGLGYGVMSSRSAADDFPPRASATPASELAMAAPPMPSAAVSSVPPAPPASPLGTAAAPVPQIPRLRDPTGDQTPDIADYVNPGEKPTMREVIDRLNQAGVNSGLGAFSPPGTRPPLIGLAVPEGFALPPGYVRHYQATDDGQRIEPILMFAPDHPALDASGRSAALPQDRVVPPELAPPGLPIRRIAIPAPHEPGRPGR
jgi:hypothetical protein